jgi:hypothetical protein
MLQKTVTALLLLMVLIVSACGGLSSAAVETESAPPASIATNRQTLISVPTFAPTPAAKVSPSAPMASELADQKAAGPSPTAASMTTQAITSCPVSLPNLDQSPAEYYISTESGYGNPEGTLFIGLWPGGKVLFFPDGPGQITSQGLAMKFWFYRTVPGDVVFSGTRLDAPAPPFPETVLGGPGDGYGETGFHPAGLVFPIEGCWRVTASVAGHKMTFVALVVKIPFGSFWIGNLPEGLRQVDTDVSQLPRSLRYIYAFPGDKEGKLIFEKSQTGLDNRHPTPQANTQPFTVHGQTGRCVQGMVENGDEWHPLANAGALEWVENDFSYRISYTNLTLSCEDLRKMVASNQ